MKTTLGALVFAGTLLGSCVAALAGNGNVLYLVQTADPTATAGNNFIANQSAGDYTTIGKSQPATQAGSGNSANVTLAGDCAQATLSCDTVAFGQDNSLATLTSLGLAIPQPQGNHASVTVTGLGNVSITQTGDANTALLQVEDGSGTITQTGLSNQALLETTGSVNGVIEQNGNSNVAGLSVSGTGNPTVTLQQNGNGHSYGSPTAPEIMVNTTQSVVIVQ